MNPMFEKMFCSQGVPAQKVVATGHPEDDLLFEYRTRYADPEERSRALEEFGLDPQKRLITYTREAVYPDGIISRKVDQQHARNVLAVATAQADAQVVMKMHPRDTSEYYDWVGREFPRVLVIHHCDFYKLIAVSDVYLSQGSSTTRWALVFNVPVVLLGQLNFEFTDAAALQFDLPPVRTDSDLQSQLSAAMSRQNDGKRQGPEDDKYALDGGAIDRILALGKLGKVGSGA